ncbi:MAG TPA: hypothetical protein EYP03_05435, partial [Aquificae bacterium]|nr:hypothetical protein [Aquificota bacterium]
FAHGKFTSQDAYKTYLALLGSLPGLVFVTLSRIYFNIYLAKEKPRSLVSVSLFTLTLNTIFDYIFIFILPLGIFGLPFATSISYFITFIFLTFKVKRDFLISLNINTYLYFFKLLTFGLFIGFLVFKISNNFENLYFRTIFEYIIFTLLYFLGGYFLFKKDILEIIKI